MKVRKKWIKESQDKYLVESKLNVTGCQVQIPKSRIKVNDIQMCVKQLNHTYR